MMPMDATCRKRTLKSGRTPGPTANTWSHMLLAVILVCGLAVTTGLAAPVTGASPIGVGGVQLDGAEVPDVTPPVTVSVSGNHLVNADGQTIRLFGVDRSGTEYACEQGWGIFDGPSDAASVAAMASWHINAVRIPMNEGCWLDEYTTANDPYAQSGNPIPYEGTAYQTAIANYVTLLHSYGIAAILDLSALDAPDGLDVPPMADSQYSPPFWSSVALYFKNDPGVIFDLYNEPNNIGWPCWQSGCTVTTADGSYAATGMQELVDAVRGTGADEPIMIGGL